jgi:flagellar basal body P-ring formation protein FlgA
MRIVALILSMAPLACAGCIAVSTDRITAADLAPTLPIFQHIEPATPFGFAPLPGTQRILSERELVLFAQKHGVQPDGITSGLCIERQARPLAEGEIQTALIEALGVPDAELHIVEFYNLPVPTGRLEFRRSGLGTPVPPDAPVMWRGRLIYDGRRSIAVWAKVQITVLARQFVAAAAIPAGSVIHPEQVKEIESRQFPFLEQAPAAIGDIAGRIARRSISAGERIALRALEQPKDVAAGDLVHVRVGNGPAVLSFDAIAQGSGKTGDPIWIHNPTSGKNFRAVIEGKGRVAVQPAPGD